jgi:hypothetical protein
MGMANLRASKELQIQAIFAQMSGDFEASEAGFQTK